MTDDSGPSPETEGTIEGDPRPRRSIVAWEDPTLSFGARLFRTIAEGLTPRSSTPLLRGDRVGPPARFALWTVIPGGLLAGVIPFTHRVVFGPSFAVSVREGTSSGAIAWDVGQAGGLGLGLYLILLVALGAPYVSLSGAFAGVEGARRRALRVFLYRSWLLPVGVGLGAQLLLWAWPGTEVGSTAMFVFALVSVVPLVLFMVALRAAAQHLNGIAPLTSWAVVIVPLALFFATQGILVEVIKPLIPMPAPTEEAPTTPPRSPPPGTTTA